MCFSFIYRNIQLQKCVALHICPFNVKPVGTQQLQLDILIGLLCGLLLSDLSSVRLSDPRGLDVCLHNAVVIYVNYEYCANNLLSRSCYEGGLRLLLPLK